MLFYSKGNYECGKWNSANINGRNASFDLCLDEILFCTLQQLHRPIYIYIYIYIQMCFNMKLICCVIVQLSGHSIIVWFTSVININASSFDYLLMRLMTRYLQLIINYSGDALVIVVVKVVHSVQIN